MIAPVGLQRRFSIAILLRLQRDTMRTYVENLICVHTHINERQWTLRSIVGYPRLSDIGSITLLLTSIIITLPPVNERNITMSMSVCLSATISSELHA